MEYEPPPGRPSGAAGSIAFKVSNLKAAAFGSMHELREMFGSIYYSIYFTVSDIAKVEGLSSCVLDG